MKDDRLVKELELIAAKMHRDADPMGALDSLINLLQYAFCDHDWVTMRAGGAPDDPASADRVTCCRKCGSENLQ